MKALLLLSLLYASQVFAISIEQFNCTDAGLDWQVVVRVSNDTRSAYGSLDATFKGWQVISENLTKSVPTHVGAMYSSEAGSEFNIDQISGHYFLSSHNHLSIQLDCKTQFLEEEPSHCQQKGCGRDGATYFDVEVPRGYSCQPVNIHCKV